MLWYNFFAAELEERVFLRLASFGRGSGVGFKGSAKLCAAFVCWLTKTGRDESLLWARGGGRGGYRSWHGWIWLGCACVRVYVCMCLYLFCLFLLFARRVEEFFYQLKMQQRQSKKRAQSERGSAVARRFHKTKDAVGTN